MAVLGKLGNYATSNSQYHYEVLHVILETWATKKVMINLGISVVMILLDNCYIVFRIPIYNSFTFVAITVIIRSIIGSDASSQN